VDTLYTSRYQLLHFRVLLEDVGDLQFSIVFDCAITVSFHTLCTLTHAHCHIGTSDVLPTLYYNPQYHEGIEGALATWQLLSVTQNVTTIDRQGSRTDHVPLLIHEPTQETSQTIRHLSNPIQSPLHLLGQLPFWLGVSLCAAFLPLYFS
jgi:hypothetical protein